MAGKISGAMERALRDWRMGLFDKRIYRIAAKHGVDHSSLYRAIIRLQAAKKT